MGAFDHLTPLAPASVTRLDGRRLEAVLTQLRPNSLMLKNLSQALSFREAVVVDVLGITLQGEVVFAAEGEAGVVFEPAPSIFEAIEAFEDLVQEEEYDALPAEPMATVDVPGASRAREAYLALGPGGEVLVEPGLDRLAALLALRVGRPLIARSEQPVSRAFISGEPRVELVAIPVEAGTYFLRLSSTQADRLAAALMRDRSALDAVGPAPPTDDVAFDSEDLPVLKDDGTVHFRSHAQFVAQHRVHFANGGLMARGAERPLGTTQPLVLVIPQAEPLAVNSAEVVFAQKGTVGFSIADRAGLRAGVEARLAPAGASTNAPARGSGARRPARPPLLHKAKLAGLPDVEVFVALRDGEPGDLARAAGSYVGIMDRTIRSGRDGRVTVRTEDDTICAWFYGQRVVAVERPEAPVKDRLGERLLAARTIDPAMLGRVLEMSENATTPVGQIVLELRGATRADVNKALRRQIMDRLVAPCDWLSGEIEVGPWTDPPGNADLLPVSGDAVVTALLRRQLQHTRLGDLREQLQPYMGRAASVDLARISESYRLTDKEQRFFQRGAEGTGTLGKLMAVAQTRALEGYRLVLLGLALGFIRTTTD